MCHFSIDKQYLYVIKVFSIGVFIESMNTGILTCHFISISMAFNDDIHRKNNAALNSVKYLFVITPDSFLFTILII